MNKFAITFETFAVKLARQFIIPLDSDKNLKFNGATLLQSNALLIPQHMGVAQSLVFITNNRMRPIRVKDLISVSTMSKRGFFKAFRRHLGRTPGQELESVRIGQAKKFITEDDCNMKDIAAVCGYRNVNTFYVAFKRVVGMSPGKFRKQHSS